MKLVEEINEFNHSRLNKKKQKIYEIPEHSKELIEQSLRKLMDASGINGVNLAKFLKVSNTTITNYINGYRRNPDKDFLIRLADYFDVKPSYFIEYRIRILLDRIELFPELLDIFLDLAQEPKLIVDKWNDEIKYRDKWSKYSGE